MLIGCADGGCLERRLYEGDFTEFPYRALACRFIINFFKMKIGKAYAKINLTLFITGKRADGYHTLETVFAPIAWHDVLYFSPPAVAGTLELTCTDTALPLDDTNLCLRAARLLKERATESQVAGAAELGVKIHLEKHVPFGAGLGGGSSDAAAVLTELNALWRLHFSVDELAALTVRLGADVAYFLSPSPLVYATGIGDVLTPLSVTLPFWIVTVFPDTVVPTAWAYKNFTLQTGRSLSGVKALTEKICTQPFGKEVQAALARFENDFEPVVFQKYPAVKEAKGELVSQGAVFARLSGSGGAVFGLFTDAARAEDSYRLFLKRYPASLTPPHFHRA